MRELFNNIVYNIRVTLMFLVHPSTRILCGCLPKKVIPSWFINQVLTINLIIRDLSKHVSLCSSILVINLN